MQLANNTITISNAANFFKIDKLDFTNSKLLTPERLDFIGRFFFGFVPILITL